MRVEVVNCLLANVSAALHSRPAARRTRTPSMRNRWHFYLMLCLSESLPNEVICKQKSRLFFNYPCLTMTRCCLPGLWYAWICRRWKWLSSIKTLELISKRSTRVRAIRASLATTPNGATNSSSPHNPRSFPIVEKSRFFKIWDSFFARVAHEMF